MQREIRYHRRLLAEIARCAGFNPTYYVRGFGDKYNRNVFLKSTLITPRMPGIVPRGDAIKFSSILMCFETVGMMKMINLRSVLARKFAEVLHCL